MLALSIVGLVIVVLLLLISLALAKIHSELQEWRVEWQKSKSEKPAPLPDPTRPVESRSPGGMVTYSSPGTAELLYRSGDGWFKLKTVRVGSPAAEQGKKKGWALRENGVMVEGSE